jgi:type II secretory pathway pseudopilin PulG
MTIRPVCRWVRFASHREDGMTIAELAVAMMLLMIAATIFLGTMTSVYTGVNRQQRRSEINDEARAAIEQIDREVRSGSYIENPSTQASDYLYDPTSESFAAPTCGGHACEAGFSVRVYTQANATTRTPPVQCVQYLVTGQKLLRRAWAPGASSSLEGWRTIATDIVNRNVAPSVPVFAMDGSSGTRVLAIRLLVNNRFGQADAPRTVRIESSIAMRNFSAGDPCTPIPTS